MSVASDELRDSWAFSPESNIPLGVRGDWKPEYARVAIKRPADPLDDAWAAVQASWEGKDDDDLSAPEYLAFEALRYAEKYPEHLWQALMLSGDIPEDVYGVMRPASEGLKFNSLSNLMATEFAPLDWVVPGVIPEGTTLLVAPPKVGKSWLALDVALAAATGTKAMGSIDVGEARPVLYIDLESGERRLQSRVIAQGWTEYGKFEYHLNIETAWSAFGTFTARHRGMRPLIVVDTLAGMMGDRPKEKSLYKHEYETLTRFQSVTRADAGAAVIIVHHTNKGKHDDPLLAIGGTNGTSGAVDTPVMLGRPDRHSADGELNVMARDFEGGEFAMEFRGARWHLVGGDTEAAQSARAEREEERTRNKMSPVGQGVLHIIESDPVREWKVTDIIGLYDGAATTNTIRATLRRQLESGLIEQPSRGVYRAKAD
jgi:hypothetical protein